MIQRRRLLAQGYILIFLCSATCEMDLFRRCLSGGIQQLFCCICPSSSAPLSKHTAVPWGSSHAGTQCSAVSGAGELGSQQRCSSPLLSAGGLFSGIKRSSSFGACLILHFRDHPGGTEYGKALRRNLASALSRSLASAPEGQGMAVSWSNLKNMRFSRRNCRTASSSGRS